MLYIEQIPKLDIQMCTYNRYSYMNASTQGKIPVGGFQLPSRKAKNSGRQRHSNLSHIIH